MVVLAAGTLQFAENKKKEDKKNYFTEITVKMSFCLIVNGSSKTVINFNHTRQDVFVKQQTVVENPHPESQDHGEGHTKYYDIMIYSHVY